MKRQQRLTFVLGLILASLLGAFCGFRGIPFTLDFLTSHSDKMHDTYINPDAIDCRPVAIQLTAASDVLQTVYTLNAFVENWRGDLVTSIKGWDQSHGCPATPSPRWSIDPPEALVVQSYFPNSAEFYPQGPGDYTVTVTFKLSDGETLRQTKTLHIPPRRARQDELARRILAGKPVNPEERWK
jgi:hypothetical protein